MPVDSVKNLLKSVRKAKRELPKIVVTILKKDKKDIIQINIENLTKGETSEGFNMPSYRDPEYANFKTSINPKNRGFWDLTLTREFINNIDLKISENEVDFFQRLNNEKTKFIFKRVPESWAFSHRRKSRCGCTVPCGCRQRGVRCAGFHDKPA